MKTKDKLSGFLSISAAMLIFGSIGIFRKYLPVPSGFLVLARSVIGILFLLALMAVTRKRISFKAIKNNFFCLCVSGIFLGVNWILLFEAYNYATVSVATLCYYMAPVFIIAVSPFLLKEKITLQKAVCTVLAFSGMLLISGVFSGGSEGGNFVGVLLGLSSAVFYASVVLLNKKLTDISPYDKTLVQFFFAIVVIVPYVLLCEDVASVTFTPQVSVLLVIVGIIHTGVAYALYFGGLSKVSAQSAALCSYIDPASALILSALVLGERMDVFGIVGAVLVLGSAVLGEVDISKLLIQKRKERI